MRVFWTVFLTVAFSVSALADPWSGTFQGEFIGDTSGSPATQFFLPSCKISFTINIMGHVEGKQFAGVYDAEFRPALKTFDPSKATDIVDKWDVEFQKVQYAQGTVVGEVQFPKEKPKGKDLEPRNEKQQRFLKRMAAALAKAMDRWKAGARVNCSTINASNGKIQPGDVKSSKPLDADAIFKEATKGLPLSKEEKNAYRAAAEVVANAVNNYSENYSGDVNYPNGAAVPGPQMPPTPNTPQTVAVGTSSASDKLSQAELTKAFKEAAGETGTGSVDEDTFALLAQSFDDSMTKFEASNQIMNAMGTGAVPSYSDKSPVGPVVNGKAQGGQIIGQDFPVDSFDDPNRDLKPPTPGPDGHPQPGAPETPRLVLRFQGMPTSVEVKVTQGIKASKHNNAKRVVRTVPLGIGFFAPGAKIHQKEFVAPYVNGNFKGRIDKEIAKPSLMKDGVIKEIAKSQLQLIPWGYLDLPELGLQDDGAPPKTDEGAYKGPNGEIYDGFAFSDGGMVVNSGSKDGGEAPKSGSIPVTVKQSGDKMAIYSSDPLPADIAKGPLARLSLDKDADVQAEGTPTLTFNDKKSHLVPLSPNTPAGVVIRPAQDKVQVAAEITVPLSHMTSRTFAFRTDKPVTVKVKKDMIELDPAVEMKVTETRAGSYKDKVIETKVPQKPVTKKPKKKPAKPKTLAELGAPDWCSADVMLPAGFSWSKRGDGGDFVKRDGKTIKVNFFRIQGKLDASQADCRAHFNKVLGDWTGSWPDDKNATFKHDDHTITITLGKRMNRTTIDFRIEEPAKKPEPEPKKVELDKADNKEELNPEKYAEMMGKVLVTVEPLVSEMKKKMEGLSQEERFAVALSMGDKIGKAVNSAYESYGVTEEQAKKLGKKAEYQKALAKYLQTHPKVKAAADKMKR